jgi:alpha-beta hydrolase superfamily lysophospholipase
MLFTAPKSLIKRLKFLVVAILTIYLAFMTIFYSIQEHIIFRPASLELSHQFYFEVPFEELFFETDEKTTINALLFKAKSPKGVVLYFHGNAGNLQRWGEITSKLTKYNYDVLVIDYRNYGKSSKTLSEAGLYHDALFCYDWLISQNYGNIIVYGRSLGCAMASYVASMRKVRHVILETPFYNIADVASRRFPILPVKKLIKYRFPNNEFAHQISAPVTILHGTNDRVVPIKSALNLYKLYGERATFIQIDGAMHNNLSDFSLYWDGIGTILLP